MKQRFFVVFDGNGWTAAQATDELGLGLVFGLVGGGGCSRRPPPSAAVPGRLNTLVGARLREDSKVNFLS